MSIYIDEEKINDYKILAKDYCLVNGLVMFPKQTKENSHNVVNCLPITLLPTKFSKSDFEYALKLQNSFNLLVHNVSIDDSFLRESLKDVIKVDEFTRRLWDIYEIVTNEGILQKISFGIIRSDYMIDSNKSIESNGCCLSQIEINTIASSFGSATTKLFELHRYMLKNTNNSEFINKQYQNDNLKTLGNGFVKAWNIYKNKEAQILFIVTKNEKNIGDQRLLEYEIMKHDDKIKVIRLNLSDVHKYGKLDSQRRLIINNVEIGVVYYRAGYDPNDYETEYDWEARLLIERSLAIKCPSIQYHLAGAKKIQQALSEVNSVEKFVNQEQSKLIRATFVDQYSFDNKTNEEMEILISMMIKNSHNYVLKPQREGGGNNIYGEDIKDFIENKLKNRSEELKGYILMKLIKPVLRSNYMIKNDELGEIVKSDFINEIGIYGCIIGDNNNIYHNETGGYLVRSKLPTTNEGGVAAGFSALDSIYLE